MLNEKKRQPPGTRGGSTSRCGASAPSGKYWAAERDSTAK